MTPTLSKLLSAVFLRPIPQPKNGPTGLLGSGAQPENGPTALWALGQQQHNMHMHYAWKMLLKPLFEGLGQT